MPGKGEKGQTGKLDWSYYPVFHTHKLGHVTKRQKIKEIDRAHTHKLFSSLVNFHFLYLCFHFYLTQVWSLPCLVTESVSLLNFVQIVGFVKIDKRIFLSWYMDFSNLLQGFFKVILCISYLLPNQTNLKSELDFKACWSVSFELKLLNESK